MRLKTTSNKPKFLYFYPVGAGKRKIIKHILNETCVPERVSPNLCLGYWRCKGHKHDTYGYDSREQAKLGEVFDTKLRIQEDVAWLRELTKDNNWNLNYGQ